MNLLQSIGKMFYSGYDATDSRGRRVPPPRHTMAEDHHADQQARRTLAASARDLARNYSVAAWAIRKHLDYVSSFTLQVKTPDRGFNQEMEDWFSTITNRYDFDSARRHPYRRAIRLAEACRVRDGDIFWMKLSGTDNRGRIQAIEGDRIRTPTGYNIDQPNWINGVRVSSSGAALSYAVCDRSNKSQFELRRIVRARNMFVLGFFDRYDQIRGVSPIAAGLNWFRDTYEGFEYAIAKAKIGQLFGVAFARDGEMSPFGPVDPTRDSDGDQVNDTDYKADLPQGMFSVDLDPGESVNMIESKTPSIETTEFLKLMLHVAIKCLDLPYSFFDESFTNFYGSRGGLMQYLKSCKAKIQDLQEFQDEWLAWRVGLAIEDGDLKLPSGKDFDWLEWEFVADGVPWWDPVKEVRGNAMAVAAGFTSPQRVCRETGTDFEENIDQIAEAQEYAESQGVDLVFADSTAFNPEITTEPPEDPNAQPAVPVPPPPQTDEETADV